MIQDGLREELDRLRAKPDERNNVAHTARLRSDPAAIDVGPDLGVEMYVAPLAADLGVAVEALARAIRAGRVVGRKHPRGGYIASIESAERWARER